MMDYIQVLEELDTLEKEGWQEFTSELVANECNISTQHAAMDLYRSYKMGFLSRRREGHLYVYSSTTHGKNYYRHTKKRSIGDTIRKDLDDLYHIELRTKQIQELDAPKREQGVSDWLLQELLSYVKTQNAKSEEQKEKIDRWEEKINRQEQEIKALEINVEELTKKQKEGYECAKLHDEMVELKISENINRLRSELDETNRKVKAVQLFAISKNKDSATQNQKSESQMGLVWPFLSPEREPIALKLAEKIADRTYEIVDKTTQKPAQTENKINDI